MTRFISYYCIGTLALLIQSAQTTCPPTDGGIYLMIKETCVNNGTYFKDSDLQIAKGQDGYIHCVSNQKLNGGQWLRPDGKPVDCRNGVSSPLSSNDPKLKDPFFCTNDTPNANITMYLADDDYFKPTAYIDGKPISNVIETEYKCCLPTACTDSSTNIMTINVFERIYITDFYADLPEDVTMIPQSYSIHCIVTGDLSSESVIKLYYGNKELQLNESHCAGQQHNGYNCTFLQEDITTSYTYSSTKDYKITFDWSAINISNGMFSQSNNMGDHKFQCTAENNAIKQTYKGRTKTTTVRAPGFSPSTPTLINTTYTTVTVQWTYADVDGYVINVHSNSDDKVIQVIGTSVQQKTVYDLIPGETYQITVRAYQDVLGPHSTAATITTLGLDLKPSVTWSRYSLIANLHDTQYSIQCVTSNISPGSVYWYVDGVEMPKDHYELIDKETMTYSNELVLIPNTVSGESLNITCSSERVSNTTITLRAPTIFSQDLLVDRIAERRLNISVTLDKGNVDGLILIINPGDIMNELKAPNPLILTTNNTLTLGTTYNITVYAYKDLLSAPITRQLHMNYTNIPNAVIVQTPSSLSQSSILISWDSIDKYRVTYYVIQYNSTSTCLNTTIESNGFINISNEIYSYNISELHAGLNYTISVRAGNPAGLSDDVSVMGYTEPSIGPDPNSITLHSIDEVTYHIMWDELPCSQQKGEIIRYTLHVENNASNRHVIYTNDNSRLLRITATRGVLSVRIAAVNSAGTGPMSSARTFDLRTIIGQVSIDYLGSNRLSSTWVYISWRPPLYQPTQYPIVLYQLAILPASNDCTLHNNHWNLTINDTIVLVNVTHDVLDYNISGLESDSCYQFVIRAYTMNGFGPWSSVVFKTAEQRANNVTSINQNQAKPENDFFSAVQTTLPLSGSVIGLSVVLLVIIFSLIIAMIVIIKRHNRRRREMKSVYEDITTTTESNKEPVYAVIPQAKQTRKNINDEIELCCKVPIYETLREQEKGTTSYSELEDMYVDYEPCN